MIDLVIGARARSIGAFDVARILPERRRRHVGPFVFLDHMGPATLAPGGGFDVLPHPHIGLATVTYLFEGEQIHRDSLGTEQLIAPGAINLMAAGRGIVHSERSTPSARAAGAVLHGLQFWVALPPDEEDAAPRFQHVAADAMPRWEADGTIARLLVGRDVLGYSSSVDERNGAVLIDLQMAAGARFEVPVLEEAAVYIVEGELSVDGEAHGALQLLVGTPGVITATKPTRAVVIGGKALPEPRFIDWNFVASSRERIERAKAAWKAQDRTGQFPLVPGDDREHVPYP